MNKTFTSSSPKPFQICNCWFYSFMESLYCKVNYISVYSAKVGLQICPCMDFLITLYGIYLGPNNYKNEIIYFKEDL